MIQIDHKLISELFDQAQVNPRLRQNYDLRTSSDDGSQRIFFVANSSKFFTMNMEMKLNVFTLIQQ